MLAWLTLSALALSASAQQMAGFPISMNYTTLSDGCASTINDTVVQCPGILISLALNNGISDADVLDAVCTSSCLSSLQSAQTTIEAACSPSDVVTLGDGNTYPATFFIDNYIFTYHVSCYKDNSTGAYCDTLFSSWNNQTEYAFEYCSDCWLGVLALQLNSPLGYDETMAEQFSNLTSSCGSSKYPVTSPSPFTATVPVSQTAFPTSSGAASSSSTSTTVPICASEYTVQTGDTCESVSAALNVSTYLLNVNNNIDLYCQNFPGLGQLCIPPGCNTHTLAPGDTCASIVAAYPNTTQVQFLSWNPFINSLCVNLNSFLGWQVCVSAPGGLATIPSATGVQAAPTVYTTAAVAPPHAMTGSNRDCGMWYEVQSGDTCAQVSLSNGLSLADFYFLNQEINSTTCANLELGESYCVAAVGSISTYSGYTATSTPSAVITLLSETFSSVATATTSESIGTYSFTYSVLPTATGTLQGCAYYENELSVQNTTSCSQAAYNWGITTSDLLAWNPSLSPNLSTCSLQSGYSYCMLNSTTFVTNPSDGSSDCGDLTSLESAGYVAPPGTASSCSCYGYLSGDESGFSALSCANYAASVGLTVANLVIMNPWAGSVNNCDLFTGIAGNSSALRALCLATGFITTLPIPLTTTSTSSVARLTTSSVVATTTTPPTSSLPLSSTRTVSSSSTQTTITHTSNPTGSGPNAPTQTGEASSCNKWHTVVSGDSCAAIESEYSISFATLYLWNPAIGSNCQLLEVGFAVCVGVVGEPTRTTSAGPPAPTQTGIASNCDKWYTVQSGDSCSAIETKFGLSFATLYGWNQAIGNNCQALWVGYAVCVGVS